MNGSILHLLDTNTATYIVDGRSQAARQSFRTAQEHSAISISAITQAEILFGLENRPGATRLRSAVDHFFATIQILTWNSEAAQAYGKLRARLSAGGKTLSAMDMLIAAHAISLNAVLVTHDKAFLQIADFLDLVDWATDL